MIPLKKLKEFVFFLYCMKKTKGIEFSIILVPNFYKGYVLVQ